MDLRAPNPAPIVDIAELSLKLARNLYYYESKDQTNTSFYLLTTALSKAELKGLQSFIWNENKADLLFAPSSDSTTLFTENNVELILYYAKARPDKSLILDTFKITETEEARLEEIKKWRFDSGAFWLSYFETLKRHKTQSIDKHLVDTLYALKESLSKISELKGKDDTIQALIDRTLYIKYLEDNHIINSYFYKHYFNDSTLEYKILLKQFRVSDINKLFNKINGIFNNDLFDHPAIDPQLFTQKVCELIYASISGTNTRTSQLSLFAFKFNIIPVDLVSYIYEVFLTDVQKRNGIYYTPKKLAQLIIDDVIPKNGKGKVLDPSCGSGMFLSVALDRLIENTTPPNSRSEEKEIEHRLKLLHTYIFGIEKQEVARRFTVFSLSLQIFRGLDPDKIKKYIEKQIKEHGTVRMFKEYSFHQNILCQNTLSVEKPPFEGMTFEYIVGNPPFFKIVSEHEESDFLQRYSLRKILKEDKYAEYIVGNSQISQCFFIKIKEWATTKTRFGFVSNSSSFDNENSDRFQSFFYASYGLEKIYELSRVKDILFEGARESVVALVFNNKPENSSAVQYYPVDMELFSDEPFKLLIIKEDKSIWIQQADLSNGRIGLRSFLLGNEFDRQLVMKIGSNLQLRDIVAAQKPINRGFEIWGSDARFKEYNISEKQWENFTDEKKSQYVNEFITKYFLGRKTKIHDKEYIKPKNLLPFKITHSNKYISSLENFHRPRRAEIYEGKKILITRLGSRLNCVVSNDDSFYDFSIYSIRLGKEQDYYWICAVLNSDLIEYFINQSLRKRAADSYPRVGEAEILQIPIPKQHDQDLISSISDLSKKLNDGQIEYTDKIANKLNELIYELYDLSYTERQRIKDYFLQNRDMGKSAMKEYKESLIDTIGIFLKKDITPDDIEFSDRIFNIRVAKVSLNSSGYRSPSSKHVGYRLLSEIFDQNRKTNYLASQERIWGKNCVYIIRRNQLKEWTQTKAFEDGREILNRLRR